MMNGVRQSKWISMTLGDSVILSLGGGVSWDDSTALGAFAKAFFSQDMHVLKTIKIVF
jgi:hypothetical protein